MTKIHKAGLGFARFFGVAASALLLGIVAAALAFVIAMRPAPGIGEGSLFTVDKGESAQVVGQKLEEKGLIRSAFAFRLLAKFGGHGSSLKAGTYRILSSMGANRILDEFVSGKQALVKVTIPEGYTLGQVAGLFDRLGLARKADFIAAATSPKILAELGIPSSSAEGYLFPDTYFFPVAFSTEAALGTLVQNFRDRLASSIPEAASLSPQELQERVILASIVEREYRSPDEAPLMASVFYNRLKIKMALQSCATVVYVITERLGKTHPDVVYDRDLKLDDPYNTYEHRGLPPGPISNPGMTSLKAVFYPATSKYLYFRLVDEAAGKHHFSSTIEEHINSRSLFVKKVGL